MNTYIALLRGINVSGQKKIKMEDLRKIISGSDFNNVQTYIQSGNIIFNSPNNNYKDLAQQISSYIYDTYDYEVPIIIKSMKEWGIIINNNPFLNDSNVDIKSLCVTFLSATPTMENIEVLKNYEFDSEKFILQDTIIYSIYPKGIGSSKMTNNFFEKKLKVNATTRNWNTTNKLFSIATNI